MIRRLLGLRSFCLCLGALLWQPTPAPAAEALTADEILQRSSEAMRPPIRYRTTNQGVGVVVSQKLLASGAPASRSEMHSPVRRISLNIDQSMYEFYPDHGVAIDATFMRDTGLRQAADIAASLGNKSRSAPQVRGVALHDGRECFEIVRSFPAEVFASITNSLPAALKERSEAMIPRESITVIDSRTFEMVETRTTSRTGSIISQSQFWDIEHPADLSDDLFLPPDGIELLKPDGLQEYLAIVRELVASRREDFAPIREPAMFRPDPSFTVPRVASRPEIDLRTGRIIPPSPRAYRPGQPGGIRPSTGPPSEMLSANEITRRSQKAMQGPIRYRLIRDGMESVVSRIAFFDGTTATRIETSSPEPMISFVVDRFSCEFYPERDVLIDTSSLDWSFIEKRLADPVHLLFQEVGAEMSGTAQVRSIALGDGRQCFEVVTAYPRKRRTLIDKASFVILETKLLSDTGATTEHCEFRDIEQPANLADDLFMPPFGIENLQPRGMEEYLSMLEQMRSGTRSKLPVPEPADVRDLHLTGSPQAAGTEDAFQHRMATRLAEARAAGPDGLLASGRSDAVTGSKATWAWVAGVLSFVSLAVGCVLVANRRWRRATTLNRREPEGSLKAASLIRTRKPQQKRRWPN